MGQEQTPSQAATPAPSRHPFLSLQPDEVLLTSDTIRTKHPGKDILFRSIGIKEPSRTQCVSFIQGKGPAPPRRTYVSYQIRGEATVFEDIIDLSSGETFKSRDLGATTYPPATNFDMERLEEIVLGDPRVQAEIERLKLPAGAVVQPEPWPYGTESSTPERRQYQVWMFLKSLDPAAHAHPSSNHFAHPLDFSVVVDDLTMKVTRIDRLPMTPAETRVDDEAAARRTWQPNPDAEYAADLQPRLRDDLRPIHVSQPEGVSFRVSGGEEQEVVEWQKWRFHLDFNWREGVVLRDVTYDGRPTFYRLSLAEMTVPYGDPRVPYHRKSAYDLGEGGAGCMSNNLELGCDCLGAIRYFDRWINDHEGRPQRLKNAICMHEVDSGIGWKHTNYRTGRAEVSRSRELVIQTIMTISNYEYVLQWVFDTAANIHYEVRATGIMSVVPADQDVDHDDVSYGVLVSPGVLAPIHQHIFCLRLDPAIDGYDETTLAYDEVRPHPRDPATNPYGVAFGVVTTPIEAESHLDLDASLNRTVKMINPTSPFRDIADKTNTNNSTSTTSTTPRRRAPPPGYKIAVAPTQLQLADPTSMHAARAEFAAHHFHFTRGCDDELYPAGEFPWQHTGGAGVGAWAARARPLLPGTTGGESSGGGSGSGSSVAVWCTFGFTHVPRPEDWPVMPAEVFRVGLRPQGFFARNPALDVPPPRPRAGGRGGVCGSVEVR